MNVRYPVFRWALVGLWSALLASTLVYATVLRAQTPPTLNIVAPADGATVDRPVTIRVEHSGIRFDGVQIGGTNEPGVGHWHVYIDDKFAGLSPTNVIEIPNDAYPTIAAGRHKITATLNENNHAPLNPPVSDTIELNFSEEVSIPVTQGGQPNLQVVFPTANATIDAPFVARVEHSGFRMEGLDSGKDPEPGTGHWHVNIDGRYAGMSVSRVLELPNDSFPTITAGQHTLTFYVHQNNHVATNPPVAASIRINVSKDLTVTTAQPTGDATQTAGTTQTVGATATVGATTTVGATRTTGATQTVGGAQAGRTPTTAATVGGAQAGRTPTTAGTATPRATVNAQTAETLTPNATASVGPAATIGLPGIPNTGEVPANIMLPSTFAIMCLILGSMLLYWSRVGSFGSATATDSGRQIHLNLGTGFTKPLVRVLRATDAQPAQRLAQLIQRLNVQPIAIRINISARHLMTARTAVAFAGGAFVGLSISASILMLRTDQTTMFVGAPVRTGPIISAPLPMAPPFAEAPAAAPVALPEPALSDVVVAPVTVPAPAKFYGPVAAAVPWPAQLPSGMEFVAEDSWPLRVIDAQNMNEPFLVFRDHTRSLVVRYADGDGQMVGTTQPLDVAGKQGALQTNADGSFQATWEQDGRTMQMSGVGLSNTDIAQVANGFKAMNATQLQARLVKEAAHRQLNITLLWPDYLPPGVNLATNESVVELSPPGTVPNADRYHLVFRGEQAAVHIGGGTDAIPVVSGTTEHFEIDGLKGQLTSGDRQFLLVLDSGNAEETSLRFAPLRDSEGRQLPRVHQGKVYVGAENLDRAQFERIVAGLFALRAPEFQAQARGQTLTALSYMWPGQLPEGFKIDLGSVQFARPDAILQGGHAFFAITATGPDGNSLTIKGGRHASGAAFVVPEGQDVEQIMTEVHGRGATAARFADGNTIVWSEGTSSYEISSKTVELDQLLAVAQGLTRLDGATWNRFTTTGPDSAPAITRPRPLEQTDATTVFTLADVPDISAAVATSIEGAQSIDGAAKVEAAPITQPIAAVLPAAPDRVVIPRLDLDTPIFSVDATVPPHNVGWYKHSGRPSQGTNIVLWGHVMRWKSTPNIPAPFAEVHTLEQGDQIILVSASGEKYTYAITKQIRVTPDKVSYLAPTEHEQLLLVSCIGDKIVVNGELTKAERLLTIAEPVN